MIDVAFVIIVGIGIFKGWRKGLISAFCSLVGFIIGITAALNLSGSLAGWLSAEYPSTARWIPFVSFTIVFLLTVLAVRFIGKTIERVFDTAQIGWWNKLAGSLIYAFLYTIIFSVFLFFLIKLNILGSTATKDSVTYKWLQPLPAAAMKTIGEWIPFIKHSLQNLQQFFEQFANKGQHN